MGANSPTYAALRDAARAQDLTVRKLPATGNLAEHGFRYQILSRGADRGRTNMPARTLEQVQRLLRHKLAEDLRWRERHEREVARIQAIRAEGG